ncbi:hypothetical protein DD607_01625 [Salmonella sp. 3DZ2-4SM]|nr:hypothetical protein DD607_01625 [Salmonella sp. 3DZ2-4SM]
MYLNLFLCVFCIILIAIVLLMLFEGKKIDFSKVKTFIQTFLNVLNIAKIILEIFKIIFTMFK